MTEPTNVLMAGDWHGNASWSYGVIRQLPELLPDEHPRIVVHCGDFGFWPGPAGERYLRKLDRLLERSGAVLWFVDGNHDWHPGLEKLPRTREGLGWAGDRIFHLPRGHRWTWHGRTWLALGGAVSLDRVIRTEGKDWWPEEDITVDQAAAVSQAGPADVMVTHECPAGVHHEFGPPPAWWDPADMDRSDANRARLRSVVDSARPTHLIHGHLHIGYTRPLDAGWGTVEVTGLDCDGSDHGNWAVLNVATMEWGESHG